MTLDQSLAEVGRDIQGTRESVAALRRKVEKSPLWWRGRRAWPTMRSGRRIGRSMYPWARFPKGRQTGRVPRSPPPFRIRRAKFWCMRKSPPATSRGTHRFRVTVAPDGGREVSFYLYATGQVAGRVGLQFRQRLVADAAKPATGPAGGGQSRFRRVEQRDAHHRLSLRPCCRRHGFAWPLVWHVRAQGI